MINLLHYHKPHHILSSLQIIIFIRNQNNLLSIILSSARVRSFRHSCEPNPLTTDITDCLATILIIKTGILLISPCINYHILKLSIITPYKIYSKNHSNLHSKLVKNDTKQFTSEPQASIPSEATISHFQSNYCTQYLDHQKKFH